MSARLGFRWALSILFAITIKLSVVAAATLVEAAREQIGVTTS